MPPKAQRGLPEGADESSFTQENYEKELRELAARAREETSFRSVMRSVAVLLQTAQILACAAVYSNLSQITLSPVYGSIPASIWHARLVVTSCLVGWAGNSWLRSKLPEKPIYYLAPIALYIPMVQSILFQLSGYLGPTCGPVLTELLTFVPLLLMSTAAVDQMLQDVDLSALPKSVAEAAPGIGSFLAFRAMEKLSNPIIRSNIGANLIQSAVGLQFLVGGIYGRLGTSKLILYAVPSLFYTAFLNPHVQTPWATFDLNRKMDMSVGFRVLARQDSLTGYISVIENTREQYRVLRCDHSLLGGVWLPRDGDAVSEPIYGVFAMLEAVRLVEVKRTTDPWAEQALVIGMGIGTTPAALISHGINTTIVEIDPLVREYALQYFSLPENHTPIIADAVKYTSDLAAQPEPPKFEYIVHDVFTGGAEPVDLFTTEFFANLHAILAPNGVIAINYAGDLLLPSARLIVRTIKAHFPICRIYRENPPPSAEELISDGRDFTNMVIFCTNAAASSPALTFRKPVKADFLNSNARKMFLLPKHEIDATVFEPREGDGGILAKNDTKRLESWQRQSAKGHWALMRTVLPGVVWESW